MDLPDALLAPTQSGHFITNTKNRNTSGGLNAVSMAHSGLDEQQQQPPRRPTKPENSSTANEGRQQSM